jgi:HEAT repeat protein
MSAFNTLDDAIRAILAAHGACVTRYLETDEILLTGRSSRLDLSEEDVISYLLESSYPVVVIGDPGCGKSTLLQRFVLRLCSSELIPLPVTLKFVRSNDSLAQLIARSLSYQFRQVPEFASRQIRLSEFAPVIDQLLATRQVAILLDGLNEIPKNLFDGASDAIHKMMDEFSWHRYLLTVRSSSVSLLGRFDLPRYRSVYHRGLSVNGAKAFVRRHKTLTNTAKRGILSAIDKGDRVSALLLNPQRLHLTCQFYRSTGTLPSTLTDIFQEELRTVASSTNYALLPCDVLFSILATVAAEMTCRGILVADLLCADPALAMSLETLIASAPPRSRLGEAVREMEVREMKDAVQTALGCPFVTVDRAQLSFIHESYQDFFSSLWLVEHLEHLSSEEIKRFVNAPSWEQAVGFAMGSMHRTTGLEKLVGVMLQEDDTVLLAASLARGLPAESAGRVVPSITEKLRVIATSCSIPELRARSLVLLNELGQNAVLFQLIPETYRDPDWLVREMGALYAGTFCFAGRPEELAELFADENYWVRAAAVWAAGEARLASLRSRLVNVSESDHSEVVRGWAQFALERLDRAPCEVSDYIWHEDYMTSAFFAGCVGSEPADFYTSGLLHQHPLVRSTSIEAIAEMEYLPAFGQMRELARDPSEYVRAWLMRSIGEARVFGCADMLQAGFTDSDPWVRFWAVESAGTLRLKVCADDLVELLMHETDGNVRRATVWALANTGGVSALQHIEHLLGSGELSASNDAFALIEALQRRISRESPFSIREIILHIPESQTRDGQKETESSFIDRHQDDIEEMALLFAQYQRPDGILINSTHIARWLLQFESPERMGYALQLLRHIDFYHRTRIASMFAACLDSGIGSPPPAGTVATILGNPTDSSSIVNYILRDVLRKRNIPTQELKAVLSTATSGQPVLFLDDNIGSGKQSVEIFRQWLGYGEQILNEEHVFRLSEEETARLRRCRVVIVACIATREGCEFASKTLAAMGLQVDRVTAFTLVDESVGCFHPTSSVFPDAELRSKAKQMAIEIGTSLLADKNWLESRKQCFALGYGGAEKLIVFFYNVPTTTLPILWKTGIYRSTPWFPLFPRREKL